LEPDCITLTGELPGAAGYPIPSEKRLKNHALIVLLGQKMGLYVNLSRVVYFGTPPSELRKIHHSACQVNAVYLLNSKPGTYYSEIFNQGISTYASLGYEGEWKKFTQGGVIGYKAREFVITPPLNIRYQKIRLLPGISR
jgi:hypothetical protein